MVALPEPGHELCQILLDQWLPTGDDDVFHVAPDVRLLEDASHFKVLAHDRPRCVRGVAPAASEVIAGGADEHGGVGGVEAFTLKALEDLGDQQPGPTPSAGLSLRHR